MKALIAKPTPNLSKKTPQERIEAIANAFTFTTAHPKPELDADDAVLVQVNAASLNPADWMYIDSTFANNPAHPPPKQWPTPMGVDGAGVVVATGPIVTRWKVGDAVMGVHHYMDGGSHAEFGLWRESELAAVPPLLRQLGNEGWVAAGALPLVLLTCVKAFQRYHKFEDAVKTGVPPSEPAGPCLIIGASGGIGSMAVLLARHFFKSNNIIAICSSKNADYVRSLGAHKIIAYDTDDISTALQEQKLEFVMDCVGNRAQFERILPFIQKRGCYVTNVPFGLFGDAGFGAILSFVGILIKHAVLSCLTGSPTVVFNPTKADGAVLERFVNWMADRASGCWTENGEFKLAITVIKGLSTGKDVVRQALARGHCGEFVFLMTQENDKDAGL